MIQNHISWITQSAYAQGQIWASFHWARLEYIMKARNFVRYGNITATTKSEKWLDTLSYELYPALSSKGRIESILGPFTHLRHDLEFLLWDQQYEAKGERSKRYDELHPPV